MSMIVLTLCNYFCYPIPYNHSDQIPNKNIFMCRKIIQVSLLVNISCATASLGNGEVEPKTRSGSVLSFKALKRKFSGPEKGQDYSSARREVHVYVYLTVKKAMHCEALLIAFGISK